MHTKFYQPSQTLTGPAYSPWFKMLATLFTVGLIAYGISFAMRFPLEAYGWGVIGHWGARRHLPEAVDWYARSNGASLTDEQLAWRARIAMRVGAWPEVRAAIEKLRAEKAAEKDKAE